MVAQLGGSANTYRIVMWNENWTPRVVDIGNGADFKLTETTKLRTQIFIEKGVKVSNLLFKAKLEKGIKGSTYSQYGKGNVTIISSNKNTLENTAESVNANGIDYTVYSDGTVLANGTATADATLILYGNYYIKNNNHIHGNVTLSGCPARW